MVQEINPTLSNPNQLGLGLSLEPLAMKKKKDIFVIGTKKLIGYNL